MQLRKATRQKAKIRLGLSAVSGGGKTYSAILVAKGLCRGDLSKTAVIDTENNSADLYAHLGDYNVLPLLPPYSPERYIEAIKACESGGMEVIIIDSIAHEWEGEGGVLQLCDQIGGGFSTAWKQMTPRHDRFKNAILQSACHIITTVRRKQDYVMVEETNKQGRTVQKPVKAGMKEITREGWEYELTVNLELDIHHMATASKDRTGLFSGQPGFIPSEATGAMILEWCESGVILLPAISEAQWSKLITRIHNGEVEAAEAAKKAFSLTAIQQDELALACHAAPTMPKRTPEQETIVAACDRVQNCKSAAEIDAVGIIQPDYVTSDPQFIAVCEDRKKEIIKGVKKQAA